MSENKSLPYQNNFSGEPAKKPKILTLIFFALFSLIIIGLMVWAGFYLFQIISGTKPEPSKIDTKASILYSNNFEKTDSLADFQIQLSKNKPVWEIKEAKLIQITEAKFKTQSVSQIILKNGLNWQNYQIKLKFNPTNSGKIGFYVRYQDNKNYYLVLINNNPQNSQPYIRITKTQNNKTTKLYQLPGIFQLGKDNEVKIEVKNKKIDFYLNSSKITIYGIDKGKIISKGTFGIFVSGVSEVTFGNFEISDLGKSEKSSKNNSNGQVLSGKSDEQKLDQEIEKLLKEIQE